jgi:cytochrome c biogenesis protein CcmG, thiol:disulfide interchange protein DsbE
VNWKRSSIGLLAAVPIVALLWSGIGRDPRAIPSPLPGKPAPDFSLPVFRVPDSSSGSIVAARSLHVGDTVHLAGHRGDVVVVNFWASWCLACRDEHRVLSEVASSYAGTNVQFLGVLYQDIPDNGRRWIAEMGGQSYPALGDPGSRAAIDYGLYGVPETFFIDRTGRVAFKYVGPVTPELLRSQIERLRGATFSPGDTAIGARSQ